MWSVAYSKAKVLMLSSTRLEAGVLVFHGGKLPVIAHPELRIVHAQICHSILGSLIQNLTATYEKIIFSWNTTEELPLSKWSEEDKNKFAKLRSFWPFRSAESLSVDKYKKEPLHSHTLAWHMACGASPGGETPQPVQCTAAVTVLLNRLTLHVWLAGGHCGPAAE